MSEVKRFDCTNGRAQHCYGCYQMTETAEGYYVSWDDFDAQRLRADTAEAEAARKDQVIEDMVESNSDMTTCLAADEQRIAELLKLLRMMKDNGGYLDEQEWERIDAALNPNPEAESHEKH